jgi:CBS domain containing-hemolysin-like protein
MMDIALPLLIILLLIVVNGIFVAAEFGIAATPRARIAQLAEGGVAGAQHVLEVLRTPNLLNRYISTAQVGITIASLGLGMYGEHAVAEWLLGPLEHWGWLGVTAAHTIATVVSVTILTYLHVVVGEMVPKSLALQAPAQTAIALTRLMAVAERIFFPLTVLLNKIGDAILRLFGMRADASSRLISSAELEYIVGESTEGGLLDPTEQIYLENVIDFSERTVFQVMTPRIRMTAIETTASLHEIMNYVQEHQHSRYPVYEGDRDHIIGVLHIKDLARWLQQQIQRQPDRLIETFTLQTLIRPAFFVPESLALEQMLEHFRQEHIQIAIAVDEFGGTAGLITLEDLAEEIIGEIQDESDFEIPPFDEIDSLTLRVRGDLLLDELNQHFELALVHDEAETVGGLIMDALGHVAESGESVDYMGVRFEVESTEGLAVNTALLYLPPPQGEATVALEDIEIAEPLDDSTATDTADQIGVQEPLSKDESVQQNEAAR